MLAPLSFLFVKQMFYLSRLTEMDAKTLGDRFRQIRKQLGITQRQLAEVTGLTQSVMSRLENGEEIYASAFVTILDYYYGKINLDFLFAPDFQADSHRLIPPCNEELQSFRRQLDILADIISTTNETCLAQIETLKKNVR